MSGKINLPHPEIVCKWKEEKVVKWLKRVHLDDCIPAFEVRHIDGSKLLDLTEQKLFTYQDLKIKHRKQIAKCVQECKSQASNAKRIAQTIKHKHKSHPEGLNSNGSYISDDYDSDDWGSDFEDESDEEVKIDNCVSELNNNTIIQPLSYMPEQNLSSNSSHPKPNQEKLIPQPPDVPVITKSINGNIGRIIPSHTNSIPRPPIKRPPSQPPPPPIPQVPSQNHEPEDYEIPIGASTPSTRDGSEHSDCSIPSVTSSDFAAETYEIIEPPEETYEMVDAPESSILEKKPVLPPRIPLSSGAGSPPPPLPQKPKMLRDNFIHVRPEGVRTFSRPKPPKSETVVEPSPSSSPSVGFIGALMGRKLSNPYASPKIEHKMKDLNEGSFINGHSVSSCDNLSSRSSSPDKDAFLTVGRSSFLITGSSSTSSHMKKTASLSQLSSRASSFDETAQNMATRPLPPVPVIEEQKSQSLLSPNTNKQSEEDLNSYPWFHEMERQAAEEVVRNLGESGSFVVRPSKRAGIENPYSITILHDNRLFHLNIRIRPDKTFALGKEKKIEKTFPTVGDLVAFHQTDPIILKSQGEPVGKTILCKYPEKT